MRVQKFDDVAVNIEVKGAYKTARRDRALHETTVDVPQAFTYDGRKRLKLRTGLGRASASHAPILMD